MQRLDETYIWERQARPVMEAIAAADAGPARAVVTGNAGSGKSTMLRELHRLLEDQAAHVSLLGESTDVSRVPRSHVLLVDDLHLLAAEQVDALRERSEDPAASLVVTSRPWPRDEALTSISRRLERSRPAIVLGHVSRSDVLTYLDDSDRLISTSCVDHLLDVTGGVTWLVTEALALHDERDCADDSAHRAVLRAIEDRIAHRLDTIPAALRQGIEGLCVAPTAHSRPHSESDEIIAHGYAEGLLTRNGQPVPLVRAAVRATIPVARILDLSAGMAEELARSAAEGDSRYREWLGSIHDPEVGAALVAQADRVLEREPRRALDLYDGALECGTTPAAIVGRRAQAAWASGDAALAGSILDDVPLVSGLDDSDRAADTSAAVWAARGMMRMSDAVYRSLAPLSAESRARATIAAVGAGRMPSPEADADASALPVDAGRGDGAAVAGAVRDPDPGPHRIGGHRPGAGIRNVHGVRDVGADSRAARRHRRHRGDERRRPRHRAHRHRGGDRGRPGWRVGAHPSLAVAVLGRGAAVASGRGPRGAPERTRAFAVAVGSRSAARPGGPRLDRAAVRGLGRTRRRVETGTRQRAAHRSRSVHAPAAHRTGDVGGARGRHRAHPAALPPRARRSCRSSTSPPIWSAHLSWAGIQQGILLNRPDDLKPHARALVSASSHSPIAAVMAQAGRVWTATLAGSVDPDAVEAAAHGLAAAGLGWDGARLAGHGASRSKDRKVSARLLSCARELHPNGIVRTAPRPDESAEQVSAPEHDTLSERELDVARLVLQGKTYAEIGQTIFISPRTAEHHIAHIRRRLGATSRSDLIAKLRMVVDQPDRAGDRGATHAGRAPRSP